MFKNYLLIFLTTSLILFTSCSQTQESEPSIYEWNKYGISFDYSGQSPWITDELQDWQVYEQSEDLLAITPLEPFPIDVDYLYTRIQIIPDIDVATQIQALKEINSYSYVEVLDQRVYSDRNFTVVHIHSSIVGLNDTNFYLTEINGNVLQLEAGILDYELTHNLLNSIEVIE